MPKRSSTQAGKQDLNQRAFAIVQAAIQEAKRPLPETLVSQVMAEMGRKGGKIGGEARAKTMSPERRSEIARKAANARWAPKEQSL